MGLGKQVSQGRPMLEDFFTVRKFTNVRLGVFHSVRSAENFFGIALALSFRIQSKRRNLSRIRFTLPLHYPSSPDSGKGQNNPSNYPNFNSAKWVRGKGLPPGTRLFIWLFALVRR